jgi:hypothetical protein
MSSGSIDNNLITQFSDMLHIQAQQNPSRLRPHVMVKQMSGDLYAYDGLGDVEAREVNGRISPTVFDEISHNRRKISRRRFTVTLPIDASDTRGHLLNPEGEYAAACMRAMNRQWDRVGVEAAFADVSTGRDFDTDVTFANDGGNTVTATGGVTYETLLELRKNWTNNEVGTDLDEKFLLLITGTEEEALLKELELTSGDFTRQSVVDNGRIARAAGIDLVCYGADVQNPILNVTAGVRDCVGLTGRALCYGMSKDMSISIKDRPDYVETKQVQIVGQWGAVRTEGVLLQKYTTTS